MNEMQFNEILNFVSYISLCRFVIKMAENSTTNSFRWHDGL